MFKNNKYSIAAKSLCFILILMSLLTVLCGCGAGELFGQTSESETSSKSSDYHKPDDYMRLEPKNLEYGDEEMLSNFSYKTGWKDLSDSAEKVSDFSSVTGYWKAVMISDPDSEKPDGKFTDLFNVEIAGSSDETSVIFNWGRRLMDKTGEELDLRGTRGGHTGTFTDGAINAKGSNSIELTDFRSDNGINYAVGKYKWSDGTEGYIGLMR